MNNRLYSIFNYWPTVKTFIDNKEATYKIPTNKYEPVYTGLVWIDNSDGTLVSELAIVWKNNDSLYYFCPNNRYF